MSEHEVVPTKTEQPPDCVVCNGPFWRWCVLIGTEGEKEIFALCSDHTAEAHQLVEFGRPKRGTTAHNAPQPEGEPVTEQVQALEEAPVSDEQKWDTEAIKEQPSIEDRLARLEAIAAQEEAIHRQVAKLKALRRTYAETANNLDQFVGQIFRGGSTLAWGPPELLPQIERQTAEDVLKHVVAKASAAGGDQ